MYPYTMQHQGVLPKLGWHSCPRLSVSKNNKRVDRNRAPREPGLAWAEYLAGALRRAVGGDQPSAATE
jgi:hypothetical protein